MSAPTGYLNFFTNGQPPAKGGGHFTTARRQVTVAHGILAAVGSDHPNCHGAVEYAAALLAQARADLLAAIRPPDYVATWEAPPEPATAPGVGQSPTTGDGHGA